MVIWKFKREEQLVEVPKMSFYIIYNQVLFFWTIFQQKMARKK